MRQMTLVAFLQAQNCSDFAASWRHPESRLDSWSPEFYQHIGRVLEAGKFDLGFFDDRLSMPDMYGRDHRHTVQHGIRCVKMDPVTVLTVMGAATKHLGLGSTASTTYFNPFDVARTFATLDLMTHGRAAWNVVTSVNDGEAENMGYAQHLEHDLRYDRADEFMEVVLGHWDSWEDGSIVQDRAKGLFAHPDKVHRLDHKGEFFRSRGPFTVPRSEQGHPVIIQAGSSGRGKRFAARWGEVIFVAYRDIKRAQQEYAALKSEVVRHGRNPDHFRICNVLHTITAPTRAEAEDRCAKIQALALEVDSLSLLSEALNFDFATKAMDEPFTTEEIQGISGMQTMRDLVLQVSGKANPTPRDFIQATGRGLMRHPWVGTPKDVADRMEEWFVTGACDGYVVGATHIPGAYEDFVRDVVPELQRRGIFRTEYTGTNLRENLGVPRPEVGALRRIASR
jgi:FMN-dependent oxidoreductase (nitrilotriacetate monooxygenase family)